MAEEQQKDREPWAPRIDKEPLFINSADYERSLGEASNPPDPDIEDEAEDGAELDSPAAGRPVVKPGG